MEVGGAEPGAAEALSGGGETAGRDPDGDGRDLAVSGPCLAMRRAVKLRVPVSLTAISRTLQEGALQAVVRRYLAALATTFAATRAAVSTQSGTETPCT